MSNAVLNVENFKGLLKGELEPFSYTVGELIEHYGQSYLDDAEFILGTLEKFAAGQGHNLEDVLKLYRRFTDHVVEEYRRYAQTGKYRYETGAQPDTVFAGDDFDVCYLYVLTLSTALNRSRYEVYRHYREMVRKYLERGNSLLEIGGGNCLDAMFASDLGRVEVYELNRKSLQWQELVGLRGKINLKIESYDFAESRHYDFVSMVELLEHVSDPGAYLRGAHRVLKDYGRAYLTFAIRMPQFDHLYHFRTIEECEQLLSETGFCVADDYCTISSYRPFTEAERWELAADTRNAVTYCCVVKKLPRATDALLLDFNLSLDN